jgi:CheY-like chemotaxis protein
MTHESMRGEAGHRYRAAPESGGGGGVSTLPDLRRRVVLVEDNRNLRVTTSRMLEHLGYAVTPVGNGAAAVELYRVPSPPDVAILDLALPGMDGRETLRAIRGLVPAARVILCSGSPDELARAAEETGADAQLAKPYDVEALSETLRKVLGGVAR